MGGDNSDVAQSVITIFAKKKIVLYIVEPSVLGMQ